MIIDVIGRDGNQNRFRTIEVQIMQKLKNRWAKICWFLQNKKIVSIKLLMQIEVYLLQKT